jgi:hypothetical protein
MTPRVEIILLLITLAGVLALVVAVFSGMLDVR